MPGLNVPKSIPLFTNVPNFYHPGNKAPLSVKGQNYFYLYKKTRLR